MRITRSFKIAVGVAILFMCTLCLVYAKPGLWERSEFRAERKHVAQYLKEKYGQDFMIKKVEYYTAYLGDQRQIRTHVISKDDPPIEFIVARYVNQPVAEYYETSHVLGKDYNRDYLKLKWNRESEARFKKVAEEIFSRPTLLYTSIVVPRYYSDQKFGTVPSYFDTLKTNPEIFKDKVARQHIQMIFFYNINESNKALEVDKINEFLSELRKMDIQNSVLVIDYFQPDFAGKAQQIIANIGVEIFMEIEEGHREIGEYSGSEGKRINHFYLKQRDVEITNPSTDIIKYFKK